MVRLAAAATKSDAAGVNLIRIGVSSRLRSRKLLRCGLAVSIVIGAVLFRRELALIPV